MRNLLFVSVGLALFCDFYLPLASILGSRSQLVHPALLISLRLWSCKGPQQAKQ